MPGLKGYTFYDEQISGPIYQIMTTNLRMPVFMNKNIEIFNIFFIKDMTFGTIFQSGSSSKSINNVVNSSRMKLSSGIELRLGMISFYSYPTSISYEFHKPLSESSDPTGKHYFTILFDFIN